ncbi:hypothetical protein GL177_19185 [Vibrio toranzoniae]|uniref:hypothetical protein n=1 Tax=Vibrio toranzoniae TaxID=1194427 RepID=UPI001377CA20|nr:hypothetical protein [Vibrio toranzoniae]NAZ55438.1 hypothetical protein [Vibrio toranzoniae]
MKTFNYYWKGQRQTRTDLPYLEELTEGEDNAADIIDGIKASEASFESEKSAD